jgi:hypothetical protein
MSVNLVSVDLSELPGLFSRGLVWSSPPLRSAEAR